MSQYRPAFPTLAPFLPFAQGISAIPFGMGQGLIQVSPQISAPIQINLGALPLSIGLFAGSAVTFLLRSELPGGLPRTLGTLAGLGLAAGGVLNLFRRPEGAPGGPAAALPGQPGGGFAAAPPDAFASVVARISSPSDFSTVDLSPFASSYPVRVQVSNPSPVPVTFTLELEARETPSPFGDEQTSRTSVQAAMRAGEVRDFDVAMPIAAWGALADYVDVVLAAGARRVPGEPSRLLDQRSFVVE